MRDGDLIAKKFGGKSGNDEDWFKLTIKGIDAQGHYTSSVDFYLADFRFKDNKKDYIVDKWSWVDLSSLGNVVKLEFRLSSSDNNAQFGMNTPSYFCFDNVNGVKPEVDLAPYVKAQYPKITVNENSRDSIIDLNTIFHDGDSELIEYKIITNSNTELLSTTINNTNLTIDFVENKYGKSSITIEATADGKSVQSTIEVEVTHIDRAPIIIKAIEDVLIEQNQKAINLNEHFVDPDGDELIYSIVSNSGDQVLNLSLSDSILTLSRIEEKFGSSIVVVKAEANGKAISNKFNVQLKLMTGVEETDETDLKIYPIPSNSHIYIKSTKIIKEVVILDMRGEKLKSYESNTINQRVELSDLNVGVYFLKVVFEDIVKIRKIIKTN
jgi:hypothetical protein